MSDEAVALFFAFIITLFIIYGIIKGAVSSAIKSELKKQTHILGLIAQKHDVPVEELNAIVKN